MADDPTPPADAPAVDPPPAEPSNEQAAPAVETAQSQKYFSAEKSFDPTSAPSASGLAMEPQPHLTVNEPLSEPVVEQNTGSTGQVIPEPTPQAEASTPSEPAEPESETAQQPAPAPAEPPVEQPGSTGQAPQSEPPEIPEVKTAPSQPAATAAQQAPVNPALNTSPQAARELLVKARAKVQTQKQKKLDKIMTEIEKHGKISNDEVEKLLHCSDATASRYLSALEKQGKIKKVGMTGAGVVYVKI